MAVSAGSSIVQRIALEGADEIKKQLAAMGAEGERAIKAIDTAVKSVNAPLSGMGKVFSGISSGIGTLREGASDFKEHLNGIGEAFHSLNEKASASLERIIPNFKELLAIGAGASVGGFIEFVKKSSEFAAQIGRDATNLGLGTDAFQDLRAAAMQAGIETEKFNKVFQRFGQEAAATARDQLKEVDKILKQLIPGITGLNAPTVLRGAGAITGQMENGVTVIRGGGTPSSSVQNGVNVLRGPGLSGARQGPVSGTENGVAVLRGGATANTGFLDTAKLSDEANKSIGELAQTLSLRLIAAGDKADANIQKLTTSLRGMVLSTGKASIDLRNSIRELGVEVPSQNLEESLGALELLEAKGLKQYVNMLDPATGKTKSLDVAFKELADQVRKAEDPLQKLAIVGGVLGAKLGPKFTEFLDKGSDGINRLVATAAKGSLKLSHDEIESGALAEEAFARLTNTITVGGAKIGLAFAPSMTKLVDSFGDAIVRNQAAISKWAEDVAKEIGPVGDDLKTLFSGGGAADMKTDFMAGMISGMKAAGDVAKVLIDVFKSLAAAIDFILVPVNAVFGTNFTGPVLLAAGAVLHFLGIFELIGGAIAVLDTAISAFITGPLVALGIALGPAIIIPAIAAIIASFVDWRAAFDAIGATIGGFVGLLEAIVAKLSGPFKDTLTAIALFVRGDFAGAWDYAIKAIQGVIDTVARLSTAIMEAIGLKQQLANQPSATGGAAGTSDTQGDMSAAGLFAGGGSIFGRGGIDNVHIMATAGEFMMRTAAVGKYGLGFMHAINSLKFPSPKFFNGGSIAPPSPYLRFADGGSVPAIHVSGFGEQTENAIWGRGGSHFTINIDGQSWKNLYAPKRTAESMISYSREKEMLSGGEKPRWFGRS